MTPTQKSHNDLYREIGIASQQIENLELRADTIDASISGLKEVVDANAASAKALDERLARMETTLEAIKVKVLAYDILKSNIRWAFVTGTAIIGAWFASFWAISGDKVVAILNPHRVP